MSTAWLDKLKNTTGETLVEALVAVLISGLGMIMLAMAVSVSSHIVGQSGVAAQSYYEANNALAQSSSESAAASIEISSTTPKILSEQHNPAIDYVEEELPGGGSAISYTPHVEDSGGA